MEDCPKGLSSKCNEDGGELAVRQSLRARGAAGPQTNSLPRAGGIVQVPEPSFADSLGCFWKRAPWLSRFHGGGNPQTMRKGALSSDLNRVMPWTEGSRGADTHWLLSLSSSHGFCQNCPRLAGCSGLDGVPPKKTCPSPAPQYLRM